MRSLLRNCGVACRIRIFAEGHPGFDRPEEGSRVGGGRRSPSYATAGAEGSVKGSFRDDLRLLAAAVVLAALAMPAAAAADTSYATHLGDLVNAYRTERGEKVLAADRTLAALAREHSEAMAKAGRMSHDEFPNRVRRSGSAMCVENVGWYYPGAQAMFDAWRKSSGHDRNMLDRRVQRFGIGVASDYVTFIACAA
jgi:uncharacterized protein YkwD